MSSNDRGDPMLSMLARNWISNVYHRNVAAVDVSYTNLLNLRYFCAVVSIISGIRLITA